ncbi:MAG TPA: iron-containing alcohol dehydrogenase [Pirellulales bacterium]|nr:iron-containing alcohol dehydrogenase [Pirellulales bacterium]
MNLDYEFIAPRQIVFGWGRRSRLAELAARLGPRVFVVLGSRTLAAGPLWRDLQTLVQSAGAKAHVLTTITREPHVEDVDACIDSLRAAQVTRNDWLLAIGGGSAIDLAKAAGALVMQPQPARTVDFLEGVGTGRTIVEPPLALVAMPTTGGTGSEATKNAVISSASPAFKKSLRSDAMVPSIVIVDPELSTSVSRATTIATGMDAITQLIESYLTRKARPLPRALAVEGLRVAIAALPEAAEHPEARAAREAMAHAALLSGMALANSGLGMAHGVAAALGIHCGVAHGLACAVMLPVAMRVNRQTCGPEMATLARELRLVSDRVDDAEAADTLVERIAGLGRQLGVPQRLGELGVTAEQIPALVAGSRGNSMSGNPRELADEQLQALLAAML